MKVLLIFLCYIFSTASSPIQDYLYHRQQLITESSNAAIGSDINFTENELMANEIVMQYKYMEMEDGFRNPDRFIAGNSFFEAKDLIEKSCVYKILQLLPKGGNLHAHGRGAVSSEYIYRNLTYRDNLYVRASDLHIFDFQFFKSDPGSPWMLVSKLRLISDEFDIKLKKKLTIVRTQSEMENDTINSIWERFEKAFGIIKPLLTYKPVFEDYYYQCLLEQYEDNNKYIELRIGLETLYDLDQRQYSAYEKIQILQDISQKFRKDHPDAWGMRLILCVNRNAGTEEMNNTLKIVQQLMLEYPGFVIGFDLIGQEDTGEPLLSHIPTLLKAKENNMKFFFHAGETKWYGEPSDLNLFDAVLLNSTRIGHAYALLKHPKLLHLVKERAIALEINPISNQVLGLVKDLRNHPSSYFIANNFPVVIASDDPGIWDGKALSYDWYYTFMALAIAWKKKIKQKC
ncbi:adenosine deaminase-like isoform X2 [Rhynchophorus ferrugineus]|uniref:adenosine deaminase-like isoform X2 n=1 Tax=Rhynchophorus ferrugineus TaxID=354439 RepID=UPI003FCC9431